MTQIMQSGLNDLLPCENAALAITARYGQDLLSTAPELKGVLVIFNWMGKLNSAALTDLYRLRDGDVVSIDECRKLLSQIQTVESQLVDLLHDSAVTQANTANALYMQLHPETPEAPPEDAQENKTEPVAEPVAIPAIPAAEEPAGPEAATTVTVSTTPAA